MNRTDIADVPWWKRVPSLDDLECKPIEWLIQDFIPVGSLVLLAGQPGTYKSWLALDAARAVATGSSFAGMKAGPAGEVLYFDRENGQNLIAWRKRQLNLGQIPNLRYHGRWVSLPMPSIGSTELLRYAADVKPLMIFDSLVRFHRHEENSNSEMSRIMNAFLELARKGATVLLLHHAGKDQSKNYRGAMEIEAAPDLCYKVTRTDRLVRLAQFKNRITEEKTIELRFTTLGFEAVGG